MAVTRNTIPNLLAGVSQQASAARLPEHLESSFNAYPDPSQGLIKRPPLKYVAELTGVTQDDGVFCHWINRDSTNQFLAMIHENPASVSGYNKVRVWRLSNGAEQTVNLTGTTESGGHSYLTASTNVREKYRAATIADTTFISNRLKTPAVSSTQTDEMYSEVLIWVKVANQDKTYTVRFQWADLPSPSIATATYTPTTAATTRTDVIAAGLATQLAAAGTGFTVKQYGSVIVIRHPTNTVGPANIPRGLHLDDSQGGTAMTGIARDVKKVSDLPKMAMDGFTVRVTGDSSDNASEFWLQFEINGTETTEVREGRWVEIPAPDSFIGLNDNTMPHTLVLTAGGAWTFGPASWSNRGSGDETTNPDPSFTGLPVEDMFLFKGRLGFLAGDAVVLSRTDDLYSFYQETMTSLLDSDPIDISVSGNAVATLQYAVPFNERLILFGRQAQYALQGDPSLTPETASVELVTNFDSMADVSPVNSGRTILFPFFRSVDYSGIREFYDTEVGSEAIDITGHVPTYIPANLGGSAVSPNGEILCLYEEGAREFVVYKYTWNGADKIQDAIQKFRLDVSDEDDPPKILGMGFIDLTLYMVWYLGGSCHLLKLDFAPGQMDTGSTYENLLDFRMTTLELPAGVYDAETNTTNFAPGWNFPAETVAVAGPSASGYSPGQDLGATVEADGSLTVPDDWSVAISDHNTIYVGIPYTMEAIPSPFKLPTQTREGAIVKDTRAVLTVLDMDIEHSQSWFYRTEVTPQGRRTYQKEFNGFVVGEDGTPGAYTAGTASDPDTVTLRDGTLHVPVRAHPHRVTIKLINDSVYPCRIQSIAWMARVIRR